MNPPNLAFSFMFVCVCMWIKEKGFFEMIVKKGKRNKNGKNAHKVNERWSTNATCVFINSACIRNHRFGTDFICICPCILDRFYCFSLRMLNIRTKKNWTKLNWMDEGNYRMALIHRKSLWSFISIWITRLLIKKGGRILCECDIKDQSHNHRVFFRI